MRHVVLLLLTLPLLLRKVELSFDHHHQRSLSFAERFFPLAISAVLKRHFNHSHEALLINWASNGSASSRQQQQQDLLNDVIRWTNAELVVRFFHPRADVVRARFYNLLVVDGYSSFRKIYETMDYKTYDSSGFYLIVITGEIYEDLNELLRWMFEDLWILDIFNVNVLVVASDGSILVYTFFPYREFHCETVKPLLWLNFTGTIDMDDIDLYPNRLRSFHGCPLKGGTFEAKPYTIIPKRGNASELVVSGFEGDLIDLLKQRLNFTVHYQIAPNGSQWGFAREKGNSTGLMKLIQEELVDFGVGCLAFTYDRHVYLKPGIAHYTSLVLFAVSAGRPFTAFEKLFCPFSPTVWYLTVVYLAIGTVVIFGLQFTSLRVRNFVYGSEQTAAYLNLLQIFFGGGIGRTPGRNFARTLLLLWVIFCFVIRTLYQGSLYLYLQRSMSHAPLETMDDIHRSGIPYYMLEIGERYFNTMPHILERTTLVPPGKDSLGKTIERLGRGTIDGAVLIPLDQAAYHNKIYPKREFVNVAKERVAVYPVGFYYPKKSGLTAVFDEQIRNIQSTGLIDFWVRRYGD
ncbi:ionotropic receptor 21a-like [Topomyia yanbarensis]|uniref:ionotropic receptor 21a-like n=1 Tax=Topomyia yanbarensis TaxID=2498891 RepID=UPI00273BA561|nr:ionotropic receptor 21a-like [Topomyia yanbarensis]